MKICNECGNRVNDNVKFCTNCGQPIIDLEEEYYDEGYDENFDEDYIDDFPEKNIHRKKPSKLPIVVMSCIIIILLGFLGKDSIIYKYYVIKGDSESSVFQSMFYYKRALNLKYKEELVNKIGEKIKTSDDFESCLNDFKGVMKAEDWNELYINNCVNRAKKNFENKDYETSWGYLEKAKQYNYNVEQFEYYDDLIDSKNGYTYGEGDYSGIEADLQDDYIISDSDTRYLTRDELTGYSKEELGYIRNEIFARYGKVFQKEKYNNYFSTMPWYSPNPLFKGNDSELNSVERANVKLIQELEAN